MTLPAFWLLFGSLVPTALAAQSAMDAAGESGAATSEQSRSGRGKVPIDIWTNDVIACIRGRSASERSDTVAEIRIGSRYDRSMLVIRIPRSGHGASGLAVVTGTGERPRPWQHPLFLDDASLVRPKAIRVDVATTRDSAGWAYAVAVPRTELATLGVGPWPLEVRLQSSESSSTWRGRLDPSGPARLVAVAPAAVGSVRQQRSGLIGTTNSGKVGGDVLVTPTPWLGARAVLWPQFPESEADEQRIRLTRDQPFLPDQRAGLSELDAIFDPIAASGLALFHSRRLGFDSLGRPAPIAGYGRVSLTAFGADVDAFYLTTDETATQRGQVYAAARLRRRFGRVRIGGLALERRAPDAPFLDRNRTFAMDGGVDLGGGWSVDGWSALTRSPRLIGGDQAYSVGLTRVGALLQSNLRFTQFGEYFNPELGYLVDRGFRQYDGAIGLYLGSVGGHGVIALHPKVAYTGRFRLGDRFHVTDALKGTLAVRIGNGLEVEPFVTRRHEGLLEPFALGTSTTLRPGHYRWVEGGIGIRGQLDRRLRLDARLEGGGIYDGTQAGGAIALEWEPNGWLTTALLLDIRRIRLEPEGFDPTLVAARLTVRPVRGVVLGTLLQYYSGNRLWTANARLTWRDRHGTAITLALDDAHEADRPWRWVRPQVRSATVKVSKRLAWGPEINR